MFLLSFPCHNSSRCMRIACRSLEVFYLCEAALKSCIRIGGSLLNRSRRPRKRLGVGGYGHRHGKSKAFVFLFFFRQLHQRVFVQALSTSASSIRTDIRILPDSLPWWTVSIRRSLFSFDNEIPPDSHSRPEHRNLFDYFGV